MKNECSPKYTTINDKRAHEKDALETVRQF